MKTLNILNLQYKLEVTGAYADTISVDDYSYTHMILEEESYNLIKLLSFDEQKELLDGFEEDFISVKRSGTLPFVHLTDAAFIPSIKENGLIADEEWIHDLGYGIYAFKKTGDIEHREAFWNQNRPGGSCYSIYGEYTGEFLECIYDNSSAMTNHVGYIVMQTGNIKADKLKFK